MQQLAAAAGLYYASAADLDMLLEECRGRVLGVVGFGKRPRALRDIASAWVDMPSIDGDQAYEVWASATPVLAETSGRIR